MIMSEENGKIPVRATRGSAGYDIVMPYDITFCPGEYTTLDTGLSFDDEDSVTLLTEYYTIGSKDINKMAILPRHWVALILPRSSLGFEYGFRFSNTICVIDMDYRDNIKLKITVDKELILHKGERIAQMIVIPFAIFVHEDTPIAKRSGGIGSTGR